MSNQSNGQAMEGRDRRQIRNTANNHHHHGTSSRNNNGVGHRDVPFAGSDPQNDGDADYYDDSDVSGGVATKGEWVELPGCRMKAPDERKREQVRVRQAAEEVERERQVRKAGMVKAYTTPGRGTVVNRDGARAAPLGEQDLRLARIRSCRARKMEQKQAREERERIAKASIDAPIQRKLERARRAQEKLEAKQGQENAQLQQRVRSQWQQWSLGTSYDRMEPFGTEPARAGSEPEDLMSVAESQRIEAAVRNSLAEIESGGRSRANIATPAPPAVPVRETETPLRGRFPAERRKTAPPVWDSVLDGPVPPGVADGDSADGGRGALAGDDWDAVLAEAISVIDWDVCDEISSDADREGFRRSMIKLLSGVAGGDERRRKVRSANPVFHANIGRWACGRRLMRLVGFFLQPQTTGEVGAGVVLDRHANYEWFCRPNRQHEYLNMLRNVVEALENQEAPAATLRTGGDGGNGLPTPPCPYRDQQTEAKYALASGVRVSTPMSIRTAVEPHDEFSRIRQEQDEAFKESLRRDRASLACEGVKVLRCNETEAQQQEKRTPDTGTPSTEDPGGRSLTDVEVGPIVPPPTEETPAQRRAKIAQSFAHLKLGS